MTEYLAIVGPVLTRCPRIMFASHIEEDGEAFYDQVSHFELERIVCKRASSPYVDAILYASKGRGNIRPCAPEQTHNER